MRNVNVALWGFGAMASGIAKVLLEKEGVTVIGACDIDPRKIGKSIYELLGVEQGDRPDAFITDDISTLIDKEKCDICVIATDSFTKKVYPKVCYVVERGVNVITTAEEMSYPMAQDPELSDAMDILAKTNNVSILGTGINPGLMMDLLAVCLSGCMTHLDKVTCKRVNSLSPFERIFTTRQYSQGNHVRQIGIHHPQGDHMVLPADLHKALPYLESGGFPDFRDGRQLIDRAILSKDTSPAGRSY